jgi:hypothetical protein
MKRHILQIAAATLVWVSHSVWALDTSSLLDNPAAKSLLEKKCIRAETAGMVPVHFSAATNILNHPGFIQAVQDEYARSISKDGKVKFPIIETAPGIYHYVNGKKQRTDIAELFRGKTEDDSFDLIYHATGKRFFGTYEVIIHLKTIDADAAGVVYTAQVHAYPHNGPLRFLARRLGVVERYFKKNTSDIAWVARKISVGLTERTALQSKRDHQAKAEPTTPAPSAM